MHRRLPLIIVLILCGAGPASQPTAAHDETAQVLQKIRADAEAARDEIEYRPSMGEKKWGDVLVLDYNGPALVARTQLMPQFRGRSLTIAGEPGICLVELRFSRSGTPMFFRFRHVDTSDSEFPLRVAELSAMPGNTHLTETRTSVEQTIMVQLIDDRMNPDVHGPHPNGECRLYLDISNTATEAPLYHKQVFEADFPSLVWNHRELCDQFVRPMLRDLGQERLMRPETAVARQVFAIQDSSPVDSKVSNQVRQLVAKLDSDDFKERRSASEKLKKLGLPAARAMQELDRSEMTPEQRNRVSEIIDANHSLKPGDAKRLGSDPAFLIDCLELEDKEVRDAAISRLEGLMHKKPGFNPQADAGERIKQLDALRRELLPFPTTQPQHP